MDEFAFRFNNREAQADMFRRLVAQSAALILLLNSEDRVV
jgi:hypothetical protein